MANKQRGISDLHLWQGEYLRQFHSVRAALHSLQLQSEQKTKALGPSKAVKAMAFHFDCVNRAFAALNREQPHVDEFAAEVEK